MEEDGTDGDLPWCGYLDFGGVQPQKLGSRNHKSMWCQHSEILLLDFREEDSLWAEGQVAAHAD